ncbi:hypothetical protein I552_9718 [Mycobacterium xenopi 3993]|nr:hypothetical protein I552_9718 [Mycobacterium xenopi 3993]
MTASGPALGVFINVYDINDDFIATVPGQTMQDGSSPNLVTNPAANSSGFQALSNQFDIPAGRDSRACCSKSNRRSPQVPCDSKRQCCNCPSASTLDCWATWRTSTSCSPRASKVSRVLRIC